jgi:hypothetical protein
MAGWEVELPYYFFLKAFFRSVSIWETRKSNTRESWIEATDVTTHPDCLNNHQESARAPLFTSISKARWRTESMLATDLETIMKYLRISEISATAHSRFECLLGSMQPQTCSSSFVVHFRCTPGIPFSGLRYAEKWQWNRPFRDPKQVRNRDLILYRFWGPWSIAKTIESSVGLLSLLSWPMAYLFELACRSAMWSAADEFHEEIFTVSCMMARRYKQYTLIQSRAWKSGIWLTSQAFCCSWPLVRSTLKSTPVDWRMGILSTTLE